MSSVAQIFRERGKLKEDLKVSDILRPSEGDVDCLICYEYAGLHPVRIDSVRRLLLLENRFGLIVGGTHTDIKDGTKRVLHNGVVLHIYSCLCLEKFYKVEQLGIQSNPKCGSCKCGHSHPGGIDMTLKEEDELKLIENNLTYCEEERKWTAAYPFIRDPRDPPNNKIIVLKQLFITERRLLKNPEVSDVYQAQIIDMKKRNMCRKVTDEEISEYDGPVYYIAHHEVWKPESKSTPCRIVFNVSGNYRRHVLNN